MFFTRFCFGIDFRQFSPHLFGRFCSNQVFSSVFQKTSHFFAIYWPIFKNVVPKLSSFNNKQILFNKIFVRKLPSKKMMVLSNFLSMRDRAPCTGTHCVCRWGKNSVISKQEKRREWNQIHNSIGLYIQIALILWIRSNTEVNWFSTTHAITFKKYFSPIQIQS